MYFSSVIERDILKRYEKRYYNYNRHQKQIVDNVNIHFMDVLLRNARFEFLQDKNMKFLRFAQGYTNSIPFETLCEVVDIDVVEMAKEVEKFFKRRDFAFRNLSWIGVGGLNYNVLCFLYYFARYYNIHLSKNPDDYVLLKKAKFNFLDNDNFVLHNLPRLYDLRFVEGQKAQSFDDIFGTNAIYERKMKKDDFEVFDICIGAPDIPTRKIIYESGEAYKMINITHKNDGIYAMTNLKPTGLEVESYGKINIPIFLLNVLKLTEFLVKFLNEKEHNLENFDKKEDNLIFEFNARKYLNEKYRDVHNYLELMHYESCFEINEQVYIIP